MLAACLALALPARAATKVAFLGLRAGPGVSTATADAVGDYVQTELANLGGYEVIGLKDLDSLIGFEQKKQLLGCTDDQCVTELAGALGVDRALTGRVSRVGGSLIVGFTLLDVTKEKVVARAGRRVRAAKSLDPVLDAVDPLLAQLAKADGQRPAAALPFHVTALVRGEVNLHLVGAALAAGALVHGSLFGVQAVVVGPVKGASLPVGLRLEARLSPDVGSTFRPYVTAGLALFSDGPALRGSAGVEDAIGSLRLFADLAYEHEFDAEFADPFLVGVGAGYAF